MSQASLTLVPDGVENPANAEVLLHAAQMLGAGCRFVDRFGLAEHVPDLPFCDASPLLAGFEVVAVDNVPGASDIYGYKLPRGVEHAVVIGNERSGISPELRSRAVRSVQIPMVSKVVNTLNVAAAAGVTLYYLRRGGGAGLHHGTRPERRRPQLLFVAGRSHVELGSAIRSAAAFGWRHLLLRDPAGVWFGAERARVAEGRAAMRAHKNAIRLHRFRPGGRVSFDEVVVVRSRGGGRPLHRAKLARGSRQLIVLEDEGGEGLAADTLRALGRQVVEVSLELPRSDAPYHFRLQASIALAEVARQVGRSAKGRRPRRPPRGVEYDAMVAALPAEGEWVGAEELLGY